MREWATTEPRDLAWTAMLRRLSRKNFGMDHWHIESTMI